MVALHGEALGVTGQVCQGVLGGREDGEDQHLDFISSDLLTNVSDAWLPNVGVLSKLAST